MRGPLSLCTSLLPTATDAQRRISKTAFTVISTGTTIQRESVTVARALTHLQLDALEYAAGVDATDAHRTVDARFEVVRDVSDDAEDRFLTAMLSTSQKTAEYARFVDDSVERVCPVGHDAED